MEKLSFRQQFHSYDVGQVLNSDWSMLSFTPCYLSVHHRCYRATTLTSRLCQAPVHTYATTRPPGLGLGQPDPPVRSTISSPPMEENLLCARCWDPQGGGDWGKESEHRAAASTSFYHPAKKPRDFTGSSTTLRAKLLDKRPSA